MIDRPFRWKMSGQAQLIGDNRYQVFLNNKILKKIPPSEFIEFINLFPSVLSRNTDNPDRSYTS